ncbi:hypothetical protein QUB60_03850 [Microcoleus sp. A2-C5]|uniref:hypothetical protein n=1 Tax=Microcoleus sp. A2-C2 TaxID=2818530 RepID=UPI002FD0151C
MNGKHSLGSIMASDFSSRHQRLDILTLPHSSISIAGNLSVQKLSVRLSHFQIIDQAFQFYQVSSTTSDQKKSVSAIAHHNFKRTSKSLALFFIWSQAMIDGWQLFRI